MKRPIVPSTVAEVLQWGGETLAEAGLDMPRLDAHVLLAHVLGCSRADLLVRSSERVEPRQRERYLQLLRRRLEREPVAYLVGERAFFDLDLVVDARALIPRPETEHLVEAALMWAHACRYEDLRIADVGTGSGAIALAVARHLDHAQVWAIDLSLEALALAGENATRYGLGGRVHLLCGDLMSAFRARFGLVLANLPYIPHADVPALMPDVAQYEPRMALDGGIDGLRLVMRLIDQLDERLAVPGLALIEIDEGQADSVMAYAASTLQDARTSLIRDYAGLERVVRIERGGR